jgi:Tol biopolymer transport system component
MEKLIIVLTVIKCGGTKIKLSNVLCLFAILLISLNIVICPVLSTTGWTSVRLTNNDVYDENSSVSSDGSKIAFISQIESPDWELFVINSDGTGLLQLTHNGGAVFDPSISGDGSKIAFVAGPGLTVGYPVTFTNYDEVYVINSDGTGLVQVTNNSVRDAFPSVSSDGSKIAFMSSVEGYWELFVINSDGTGLKQLTSDMMISSEPCINGDGSKIAFTAYGGTEDSEVYVINSDGTGLIQLTNNDVADVYATISEDGTKIAFLYDASQDRKVFIVNSDGSGLTELTSFDTVGYAVYPCISGNGLRIALIGSGVYVINSDGTGLTQVANELVPTLPSINFDGSVIAYNARPIDAEYEIYVVSFEGEIPEFSSWVILPLVLTITLFSIIVKRKLYARIQVINT